jgi:hypothetical protein
LLVGSPIVNLKRKFLPDGFEWPAIRSSNINESPPSHKATEDTILRSDQKEDESEDGGAEGIRTPDPHNAIVVLYQLSYDPIKPKDQNNCLS